MNKIERLHIIDLLKGVAIVFVIFTHYNWKSSQRAAALFPFWIGMAVPIFMIISGYVNSLSYKTKDINELSEMYNYKNIIDKLLRFMVPFLIAYLIEIPALIIVKDYSLKSLVKLFFTGGLGPGSYYNPIMIQFIFIFPVIYKIINKYDIHGLVGLFIFNFIFEILKCVYGMPSEEYRLIVFRYIGFISFGCYLAISKKELSKKTKITSLIIGSTWLLLINYLKYKPLIINKDWAGTSIISAFYIMPIFDLIVNKYKKTKNTLIELIGKASYNIFLTQMVYFTCADHLIVGLFNNNVVLVNIVNIVICVLFGLAFYYLENRITKKVISNLRKHDYFEEKIKLLLKIN